MTIFLLCPKPGVYIELDPETATDEELELAIRTTTELQLVQLIYSIGETDELARPK